MRLRRPQTTSPPVFVLGCARSGTSILGETLAAHPRVSYLWEAHSLWESVAGLGPDGSHRLDAAAATPAVSLAIRSRLPRPRPGQVLLEKNPRHTLRVPFLKAVFPDARLVHIVRDGRDVACSLVPGIGGAEWGHLKPPGWRSLMERWKGLERCARAWQEIVEIALADLATEPHLQVRYEDLVRDPYETVAVILDYMELPPSKRVERAAARISDRTDGSHHAAHQTRWFRPDHARRVGRYRENMAPAQRREITALLAPLLERLGYPVEDEAA